MNDEPTQTEANLVAKIEAAVLKAKKAGEAAAERRMENEARVMDACGFATVVTFETKHPLIRQMHKMGIIRSLEDEMASVSIRGDWERNPSISFNEYIARTMSETLNEELGDLFNSHSWLD